MEESTNQRTELTFSTEAVLLSVIPAYILLSRYVFELGVAERFGYPHQLISVSTSQIFLSFAQALVILALFVFGLNFIDWLFVKTVRGLLSDNEASFLGLAFAWWLTTIVITLFLNGLTWQQLKYMTLLFIGIPALIVVGHKLAPPVFAPIINKFLRVQESSQMGIFGTLRRVFGERTVVITVFLLISLPYWYFSGFGSAGRQTDYLMLNENEVVVRIYDDRAIVNKLTDDDKLSEGFSVLLLGDNPELVLMEQNVGNLTR